MHRGEAHLIPQVLPTQCLKNGCHGSFLQSPEAISDSPDFSDMMESVISLGPGYACFLSSQTWTSSVSLSGLELFLFLEWEGFCFPSPFLEGCEGHGNPDC